jgi:hypothetical protein
MWYNNFIPFSHYTFQKEEIPVTIARIAQLVVEDGVGTIFWADGTSTSMIDTKELGQYIVRAALQDKKINSVEAEYLLASIKESSILTEAELLLVEEGLSVLKKMAEEGVVLLPNFIPVGAVPDKKMLH